MKNATKQITQVFPMIRDKINCGSDIEKAAEALKGLGKIEKVFLELCWFFENPEHENFNLRFLYEKLEGDWLEFALSSIETFFEKDTFLLPEKTHTFVRENVDDYKNQKEFAKMLTDEGIPFSDHKISVYFHRGVLPKEDLMFKGKPYWLTETIRDYIEQKKDDQTKKRNKKISYTVEDE
ncbi:hypothetical protein NSQ59_27465 [Margalitia sp. FSL K6-0131]|uniref:hypothetical protein n=1 Tax=Margalitia sp. FSL K6-0131 TaxID=2954604 RepID=UPI0030F9FC4F